MKGCQGKAQWAPQLPHAHLIRQGGGSANVTVPFMVPIDAATFHHL
ncbi:MAG: hypothetical protein AVDCRST_MAG93-1450 [uncultured Chloroflexia bacterium]|uniref:Uncharacterized protein n=1 Tax=uncultured Chloroflexia bacterium TaxID=1672391 RepID=A0A6J4I816_9CHLR|nr:MAG: hypothetical protein AVDCRST_MAG93-1450 [uncultured Chloroflexia bacterium]